MIELFCSSCRMLKKSVCFAPCMVRKWTASPQASIQCIACTSAKRKAKIRERQEFRFGRQAIKL